MGEGVFIVDFWIVFQSEIRILGTHPKINNRIQEMNRMKLKKRRCYRYHGVQWLNETYALSAHKLDSVTKR